ncbi:MAG: tetratricopeptide repeat protein [Sandaracinaceae bacterium]|nr:tetratricopeptide repeat protein [Sandaracinaceae bacterium]
MAVRQALAVFVLSLALAGVTRAGAQANTAADQRALALYEQGSSAYTEGRYEDAIRLFTEAYELSPRPLLLYNLANAYERVGRYADAVQMLEYFQPHAPYAERAVIQSRITNLRARVEAGEGTSGARGGGGGGGALVPAGIGVAAGGLALVAAGVVFGVLALDARASAEGQCRDAGDGRTVCTGAADGALADAELFALLADVGLIGGGVVAAAGVVLLIVGAAGGGGSSAAIAPDVRIGLSGGTLGVRGRF